MYLKAGMFSGRARAQLRDGRGQRHALRRRAAGPAAALRAAGAVWQTTLIGRGEIWPVHQKTAELGGMLRSGLEDTFYLPDGRRAAATACSSRRWRAARAAPGARSPGAAAAGSRGP
jgi:3-keto-5-aminohexanoate cleavage enzyme